MDNRQVLGILGSLILFLGVFAPILSIPIAGDINYFRNGKGDGTIILVFAGISFVLTLMRTYKGLWFTGLASLALLAFTFFNFQSKMSEATVQMNRDLAGNPFRGFADVAIQSVQLQWGWALLVVGAVLLISAAAIKPGFQQAAIEIDENIGHVAKYLTNPVLASEYAASKGISEEDVKKLVNEGKLKAYSFRKQLYVSDT